MLEEVMSQKERTYELIRVGIELLGQLKNDKDKDKDKDIDNTIKERPKSLLIFESFDHSDKET